MSQSSAKAIIHFWKHLFLPRKYFIIIITTTTTIIRNYVPFQKAQQRTYFLSFLSITVIKQPDKSSFREKGLHWLTVPQDTVHCDGKGVVADLKTDQSHPSGSQEAEGNVEVGSGYKTSEATSTLRDFLCKAPHLIDSTAFQRATEYPGRGFFYCYCLSINLIQVI